MTGKDWVAWHAEYDRPGSSLAQRLAIVRRRLWEALDAQPPGPVRIVSACAGQGRDVLGVLPEHPRRPDVERAVLIEYDPTNVEAAAGRAASLGLADRVEVRRADAGHAKSYVDAVPAGIVLLCGVFGNVSDEDIHGTVHALPQLCAPGATVIWTRHREPPDLTPTVRSWFASAGFEELAFDAPEGTHAGIGTHRLVADPAPFQPDRRYFTFA